ncbi:MAG TPA: FAD-dependent oxidoreductase, partial [Candidatus Limnocylindrales bacterium]
HHAGDGTTWQYLPDGEAVGIPYRTLVVRDAANVLVAGRCFSATHDAHASVRSMAQCMAMGQAAGTAAAHAVASGGDPRDIDVAALRDRLRADGAILELAAAPRAMAR